MNAFFLKAAVVPYATFWFAIAPVPPLALKTIVYRDAALGSTGFPSCGMSSIGPKTSADSRSSRLPAATAPSFGTTGKTCVAPSSSSHARYPMAPWRGSTVPMLRFTTRSAILHSPAGTLASSVPSVASPTPYIAHAPSRSEANSLVSIAAARTSRPPSAPSVSRISTVSSGTKAVEVSTR